MTLLAFLYISLCPFSANVEYRFYQIPLLKIETKPFSVHNSTKYQSNVDPEFKKRTTRKMNLLLKNVE